MIFKWHTPFRVIVAHLRLAWARWFGYEIMATDAEAEDRLDICWQCEEYDEGGQCKVCTCFVDAKTMLLTEQCPKRKWFRIWRKKSV
jgi:uncharacterized protein DUF6171